MIGIMFNVIPRREWFKKVDMLNDRPDMVWYPNGGWVVRPDHPLPEFVLVGLKEFTFEMFMNSEIRRDKQ